MQSLSLRAGVVVFACLLVVGVAVWMSSGYSRISDRSYDYALALVSACGRQDEARVRQIAEEVDLAELPAYDRRVILAITKNALNGDWQTASARARTLLKAQVLPAD